MLSIFILKFSKTYILYVTGKFKTFSCCFSYPLVKSLLSNNLRFVTSSTVGKSDYMNLEWNLHLPNKMHIKNIPIFLV